MTKKVEKWVDDALRSEIDFSLRNDFKDKVIKKIKRKERISQRKLYFWMTFGIVAIVGCGFLVSTVFAPALFKGLENFDQVIPIAIVVGVAITAIQYLDKVLVKNRLFGS